jgi:hypothetical protein
MPPKKVSDLLERTEELLRQYDVVRFQEDNLSKLLEIENELNSIRQKSEALSSQSEFDLYPRVSDENFGQKLAMKKEFAKSKYGDFHDITRDVYEKHANAVCNRTLEANNVFRLSQNQILLKNFLNPKTPYNSILLYHGVGVGKCHGRGTKILMWSGEVKEVQDIKCGELLMGDDGSPREVISLAQGHDMLYKISGGGVEWTGNSEHILCLKYVGQSIYYDVNTRLWLMKTIHPTTYKTIVKAAHSKIEIETLRDLQQDSIVYEVPIKTFLTWPNDMQDSFIAFRVNIKDEPPRADLTYEITITAIGLDEYFGFILTGNHRYLLHDLTVTHNTCTAITIAENFNSQFKNKTLVLLPSSIKDNFRRQIFDVNKLSSVLDSGDSQCVASKYLNLIPDKKTLTKEGLEKRVNKQINGSYEFMGFMEFGNLVKGVSDAINKRYKGKPEAAEAALRLKLRKMFSDRVIIVDEVHNARAEKEATKKRVPPLLLKTLESAQNVKLVLCTATPVFNSADEIVWLLNYMLANEKRPLIDKKDLFASDGDLKNPELLASLCRGLVSFMRGDNPFTFPVRLYPSFNRDGRLIKKIPSLDINGNVIPDQNRLKSKEIVLSPMSEFQSRRYKEVKEQLNDKEAEEELEEDIEDIEIDEKKSHISMPIQISNIVFPTGNYGKAGFEDCFRETGSKCARFAYKKDYKDFLSYENLGQYSSKLRTIAEYILNSRGIVFVYSYYIWSALVPLAITLEHMGLKRHGGDSILADGTRDGLMSGSYSLLVREPKFCVDLAKEVQAITDPANKDGNKIKVILASSVVAEGIDFKRIREVHIVEPWYHQNRAEQIIGRAVRTCSHTALPIHERNVTIYQHAAVLNLDTKQESIDLQVFRIAEQKQEFINKVLKVLRDNSIDCQLNKGVSYFDPNKFNFKTKVVSSQSTVELGYKWGDKNTAYQTSCTPLTKNTSGKDDSTFTTDMYLDDVGYYADFIMGLYRNPDMSFDYIRNYTYEEIRDAVKELMSNMDEDILKYTLNVLLHAGKSREYLAFIGKKYIVMPASATFGYVSMKERRNYKPITLERLVAKNTANGEKAPAPVTEPELNTPHQNTQLAIFELIEQRINACKERLAPSVYHKIQTVITDYVIDRLSQEELDVLFLQETLPSYIKASLQRAGALLELEPGQFAYRSPFKPTVWVWRGSTNNLELVPPVEINKHATKVKNLLNKHVAKKHKCFIDFHKTHGFQFKLLSDKENSTGCNCAGTATNLRDDIIKTITERGFDYMETLLKKDASNKDDLCFLLEIATRSFEGGDLIKRPLHYKDFKASQKPTAELVVNSGPKKRGRKPKN